MSRRNTEKPPIEPGKLQFDWNLVQSFLAVIDAGSLQAAARELSQSQPTMGRHVELLESQLGVALFERTGRALVPTEQGRHIASIARNMQSGADEVCRLVQSGEQELSGAVRVSASRVVATHLLPAIVRHIQQNAPDINITVVSTDEVSNLLRRDADIAIRMVKPKQQNLIAKRVAEMPFQACASQSYIDRWGMPREFSDLLKHRLIAPDQKRSATEGVASILKGRGIDPASLRISFCTDDYVVQVAAAKEGLGIAFVSQVLLQQNPDLVPLPITMPIPALPVWLAVHREIRSTPRIRLVFDQLDKLLRESLGR